MLVNHADAGSYGSLRLTRRKDLLAAVRVTNEHLSPAEFQINAVRRQQGTKSLGHPAHGENRAGHGRRAGPLGGPGASEISRQK